MARKETDTVALTLRIRERLRWRIQEAADREKVSLNSEITDRLENSFLLQRNDLLIETLLGSGFNLKLLQMMSAILKLAGKGWINNKQRRSAVVGAISKIIALAAGEAKSLPKHPRKDSADYFANMAIMFSPDWMPLEELVEMSDWASKPEGKGND